MAKARQGEIHGYFTWGVELLVNTKFFIFCSWDELSVAVAPALKSSQREHLEEVTVLALTVGGTKDMVVPVAQMGVLPRLEPTI